MAFLDPQTILERFHLGEGVRVADLGAGTGAWSIAAAKLVGAGGRVTAIDIQKELADKAVANARAAHVSIEIIWGDLEKPNGSTLKENSVDAVILANILFQVTHKNTLAEEAFRILRPGGKALVVDWSESFGGLGPQSSDVVPQFSAEDMFKKAGFSLEETIPGGDHHYGLIFRKKGVTY